MKNNKKIRSVSLLLVFSLLLAGCNQATPPNTSTNLEPVKKIDYLYCDSVDDCTVERGICFEPDPISKEGLKNKPPLTPEEIELANSVDCAMPPTVDELRCEQNKCRVILKDEK